MERAKKLPRYVDVAAVLDTEIGQMGPNSLLQTEEQLARRFGVSRVTVRGALDLLERSGRVSRLRGRGTIVSPQKVTRRFSPLYSFEKDMASQGIAYATRVLQYSPEMSPPEPIRRQLQLRQDEKTGCLSLVRLVDDRIVCHELRYYPARIANRIDPLRAEREDASEILEDVVGAPIVDVSWESEIISASREVAQALGIASRALVLANLYTWLIAGGVPVEAGVVSYRVDRCKFKFEARFQHS